MKIKLRGQLLAAFMAALIVPIANGIWAALAGVETSSSAAVLSAELFPVLEKNNQIGVLLGEYDRVIMPAILFKDSKKLASARATVDEISSLLDSALAIHDDPALRDVSSRLNRQLGDGLTLAAAVHGGSSLADAKRVLGLEAWRAAAIVEIVNPYRDQLAIEFQQSLASMQANCSRLVTVTCVLLLASILVSAGVGILFSQHLKKRIDQILGLARAMRGGNLAYAVDASANDELGELSQALNQMCGKVGEVVSQIRLRTREIVSGTKDISQGNGDLSGRTNLQAASLEEASARMIEMTDRTRKNAEEASGAQSLASEAECNASDGGSIATDAISSMAEIETGSKKIADISSVIDEIAFQTNLLALNAAIEAERAGEHGRGFAVVAAEVRKLAERSSGAAREIKSLIDSSLESVRAGTGLVRSLGEALGRIVGSAQGVSEMVNSIASASLDQQERIEEVSVSVKQMEQMTTQNSSLVEETAAASASLDQQAVQLRELVDFFQCVDDAAGQAAVASVAPRARADGRSESTQGSQWGDF